MSSLPGEVDFEGLSTHNLSKMESSSYVEKQMDMLSKKKAAYEAIHPGEKMPEKGVKRPLPQQPQQTLAPTQKKLTATDIKRLNAVEAKKIEASQKPDKLKEFMKLQRYRTHFPIYDTKDFAKLSPDSSLDNIQYALNHFRSSLQEKSSDKLGRELFLQLVYAIEYVTEDVGFNPLDLHIKNIGTAVSMSLDEFETELTEMGIELSGYTTQPWHIRIAMKLALFVKTYSDERKKHIYANKVTTI